MNRQRNKVLNVINLTVKRDLGIGILVVLFGFSFIHVWRMEKYVYVDSLIVVKKNWNKKMRNYKRYF